MFRLRWICAALLLLALSLPLTSQNSWAQGVEQLKRALDYEKSGNRAEALRLYASAIQAGDLTRQQMAFAHHRKGGIHGALGDNSLGIQEYTSSLQYDPNYGQSLSLRGYLRGVTGQYDLAEQDHRAAINLADHAKWADYLPWTLQHMADLLRRRGEFTKAIEHCDRALQKSSYAPVYLRRAWINLDRSDIAGAKADFAAFQRAAEEQKISFDIFWPDEREAYNRLSRL